MPAWSVVLILSAGSLGTGYLISRYFLKRANLKPSHKGLLVGGVAGMGVFLLYVVLKAFGINLFQGATKQVFHGVLTVAFLSFPARMMLVRLRSGRELADLGPSPLRTMFLGCAALLILVAAGGLIARSFSVGQAIVNLAQGVFFVALGLAHSQIRSHGINYGGGLLPWNRIARYEWSNGDTLMVDLHRPHWWQERVQLRVPPVLVHRVDELMRLHVAAKA